MEKPIKIFINTFIFLLVGVSTPVGFVFAEGLTVSPTSGIFMEENFFPGKSTSENITINSSYEEEIDLAVRIDNVLNDENLLSALWFTVGEKSCGTMNSITNEWCFFGKIDSESEEVYQIEIFFDSEAKNKHQDKEVSFDIVIGSWVAEGEEDDEEEVNEEVILSVGRSGEQDVVLEIFGEDEGAVTQEGATIIWSTNIPATSKVIYGLSSNMFDYDAGAPAYGYEFYKEGDDSGEEKVTFHQVTLTDLLPGTTYYYRVVSYASPPSISRQYFFTTADIAGEADERVLDTEDEVITMSSPGVASLEELLGEGEVLGDEDERDPVTDIREIEEDLPEEEKSFYQKFFATLGIGEVSDWRIIATLLTVILFILFLLKKRRRKDEYSERNKW